MPKYKYDIAYLQEILKTIQEMIIQRAQQKEVGSTYDAAIWVKLVEKLVQSFSACGDRILCDNNLPTGIKGIPAIFDSLINMDGDEESGHLIASAICARMALEAFQKCIENNEPILSNAKQLEYEFDGFLELFAEFVQKCLERGEACA